MADAPAIEVEGLKVYFPSGDRTRPVRAVDGIDLAIPRGAFHGIVGESGCGKTTLARTIVGLQRQTEGRVLIGGRDRTEWRQTDRKAFSRHVQFVFQDPLGSLSRRQTVLQSLDEPLAIHGLGSPAERRRRVEELLDLVALPTTVLDRLPRSLSGGQRQRVAIARALALNPSILVCDEPLSALDVSIRAQIVNLFRALQARLGLTIVLIAHDLAIVREICTGVTVMYLGRIAEAGVTAPLFETPAHPYSQALLSAVPSPDPRIETTRKRIVLAGDPPSPRSLPSGCRFSSRCPVAAERCRIEEPALRRAPHGGEAACHFVEADKRPVI